MAETSKLVVGERWFYRPTSSKPATEVVVLGSRPGPPPRVRIGLVHQDGEPEIWVPPTQLKALWSDRDAYLAAEAAWRTLSSEPDGVEWQAVVDVFELLVRGAVEVNWNKPKRGTLTILDSGRIDRVLGGDLRVLVDGAERIDDSAGSTYGWATAVKLARRAAELRPDRIIRHVLEMEAESRRLQQNRPRPATAGGFGKAQPSDLAFQEEFIRPLAILLREWCGKAVDLEVAIREAQREGARLSEILLDAVVRLAAAGDRQSSWMTYERAFPDATAAEWQAALAHRST